MKIADFVIATKVSEAYSALHESEHSTSLIAGGTSMFFSKSRVLKKVIDINRIPMRGITKEDGVFKIGACTTINELLKYKASGWVLNRVALHFVNQQVRNIATIGGNVARVYYWCDFPVALRVLEGSLKLTGSSTKRVKISDAFHNMQTHRSAFKGSILEYIEVPALSKGMGFGYAKETRTSEGFSSATTAAFVEVKKGLIEDIRISIGAVMPFPMRLFDIEKALKGQKAERSCINKINFDKLNKYHLVPREGMTLDYCKHLLKVRISDVIGEALAEATGENR